MILTYDYSFAHYGVGVQAAWAWFSAESAASTAIVGTWSNVIRVYAGLTIKLTSGRRIKLEA